jgi:asparagine synthase (glutamine-hydrolysing)
MCGICGFSGRFGPGLLREMNDAIAHRGPDGQGELYLLDQEVGLAHRRLSIIDVSEAGSQPMWDASGTACITYNGELYNFRELRIELEAAGVCFRGHSDTEVLINLYVKYGRRMLPMLNGIFALAIWDARSREILVARDSFGVKPIYYTRVAGGVLFASEMKALFRCPGIDRDIDADAVLAHLVHLWSPSPATVAVGVRKLEPGMAMRLSGGAIVEQWRYFDLQSERPLRNLSEGDAIAEARAALATAVRRQMVADVPVGAFLSGGLDSSAVVAFAREASPGARLQCFTIGFDERDGEIEGMAQDLPYAERVAKHLDVDLHKVHVGPQIAHDLPQMIYHLDEPQADPAAINVLMIAQLARAHGIKVLLSGAAGDDLFTGYRRHRALMLERYWAWLPAPVRAALSGLAAQLPARPAALRRLRKAFENAALAEDARIVSYFNWLAPSRATSLLSPDLRAQVSPANPLLDMLAGMPAGTPALNRMLALECRFFLTDHNLNYTDKMSMACGVETRVPFLDNDLAEFAFSLPLRYKQRGRTGKWVLKQAMRGLLPDDVIDRPKTGFGAPVRAWLRGPLRELVGDTLSPGTLRRRGLFDPNAVANLMAADSAGRIDAAYPLLSVLCMELWCRLFLDGGARKPNFAAAA